MTAATARWPAVLAGWLRLVQRRVHEPEFWVVQALVVGVAALHVLVEATHLQERIPLGGVGELPVVLHLIPVVYAGFRYGYEGSVLTGLWSGMLAVPNIVFWHGEPFGWMTDLTFIGVVIGLGVVIAVPVERERRQRHLAEAASQRLGTLNGVAAGLAATTELRPGLTRALEQLVADLPLRRARLECPDAFVGGVEVVGHGGVGGDGGRPAVVAVPLEVHPQGAELVVELLSGRGLQREDRALLSAAARQIGAALEADLLRVRERDRLRTYAYEVTRAQEQERARIARDLHDVVAQELAQMGRRLDDLAEGRGDVHPEQLRVLTDEILDAVRHVSRGLRPPALEDLGLVVALRSMASDFTGRAGVVSEVEVEGVERRLVGDEELTLYRIAQEAVRNAERHAAPRRVAIRVCFSVGAVEVVVSDDGRGFSLDDEPALASAQGLGLMGMRERAELAGGELWVSSSPGRGTTVTARLPAR